MHVKSVNLETVCGVTSVLPKNDKIEIAFAGKSNVGKSSLINALMNRKAYARTSSQPGKTQTINFYNINNELYYVDLPGYGYAKVSMALKEKWGKLIEKYLRTSEQLRIIFLLLDIRHEPSANDKNMYDWIVHNGYNPVIIATKLDKINRSQKDKQIKIIRKALNTVDGTPIIPFSSVTKQGRDEIMELIEFTMRGGFDEEYAQSQVEQEREMNEPQTESIKEESVSHEAYREEE
nr:ribosome biogenesis GTP-binding protein YihA/YsxC [Anaerosporobacter faecicola]